MGNKPSYRGNPANRSVSWQPDPHWENAPRCRASFNVPSGAGDFGGVYVPNCSEMAFAYAPPGPYPHSQHQHYQTSILSPPRNGSVICDDAAFGGVQKAPNDQCRQMVPVNGYGPPPHAMMPSSDYNNNNKKYATKNNLGHKSRSPPGTEDSGYLTQGNFTDSEKSTRARIRGSRLSLNEVAFVACQQPPPPEFYGNFQPPPPHHHPPCLIEAPPPHLNGTLPPGYTTMAPHPGQQPPESYYYPMHPHAPPPMMFSPPQQLSPKKKKKYWKRGKRDSFLLSAANNDTAFLPTAAPGPGPFWYSSVDGQLVQGYHHNHHPPGGAPPFRSQSYDNFAASGLVVYGNNERALPGAPMPVSACFETTSSSQRKEKSNKNKRIEPELDANDSNKSRKQQNHAKLSQKDSAVSSSVGDGHRSQKSIHSSDTATLPQKNLQKNSRNNEHQQQRCASAVDNFATVQQPPLRISEEAKAIMERNARLLGLEPLETQVQTKSADILPEAKSSEHSNASSSSQSSREGQHRKRQQAEAAAAKKVPVQQHNHQHHPSTTAIPTRNSGSVTEHLNGHVQVKEPELEAVINPILPKKKVAKPASFAPLEVWKRIDVADEVSRRRVPDPVEPGRTPIDESIEVRLIPVLPSKQELHHVEPIYSEYDERLPDFKKRLIETGSFEFPEDSRQRSPPHKAAADSSSRISQSEVDRKQQLTGQRGEAAVQSELTKVNGNHVMTTGTVEAAKHGSGGSCSSSFRQLKQSFGSIFKPRSRTPSEKSWSKKSVSDHNNVANAQLSPAVDTRKPSKAANATSVFSSVRSLTPSTTKIKAGDSSDIDFSWVNDLETKFQHEKETGRAFETPYFISRNSSISAAKPTATLQQNGGSYPSKKNHHNQDVPPNMPVVPPPDYDEEDSDEPHPRGNASKQRLENRPSADSRTGRSIYRRIEDELANEIPPTSPVYNSGSTIAQDDGRRSQLSVSGGGRRSKSPYLNGVAGGGGYSVVYNGQHSLSPVTGKDPDLASLPFENNVRAKAALFEQEAKRVNHEMQTRDQQMHKLKQQQRGRASSLRNGCDDQEPYIPQPDYDSSAGYSNGTSHLVNGICRNGIYRSNTVSELNANELLPPGSNRDRFSSLNRRYAGAYANGGVPQQVQLESNGYFPSKLVQLNGGGPKTDLNSPPPGKGRQMAEQSYNRSQEQVLLQKPVQNTTPAHLHNGSRFQQPIRL